MDATTSTRRRVLILGAAGRDFHDFNMVFRNAPAYEVVAFTATQIPDIAGRVYPLELAGDLYPRGIPIVPEAGWDVMVREQGIDDVVFAFSDVSHVEVMHYASRAVAAGATFWLPGARETMLQSVKPVVSVCAVRTGCGKSPVSRYVAGILRRGGLRVAVVRHPMPYGDLRAQAVQRFATMDDVARAECTVEEREEYEPHINAGDLVFAGVDYERILRAAESEADVILWDGGNNDLPFFVPDLEVVLVDPHRLGHETTYYPGEASLLRADVVVIAKADTAEAAWIEALRTNVRAANPRAAIVEGAMPPRVDRPDLVQGKRVLVIEDGPTLTHGGMAYGAGTIAARAAGAVELVDPRPHAVGSIREAFARFTQLGPVLPALGYTDEQFRELEQTIASMPCDAVVIGTPADLSRVLGIAQPVVRVTYEYEERGQPRLRDALDAFAQSLKSR